MTNGPAEASASQLTRSARLHGECENARPSPAIGLSLEAAFAVVRAVKTISYFALERGGSPMMRPQHHGMMLLDKEFCRVHKKEGPTRQNAGPRLARKLDRIEPAP